MIEIELPDKGMTVEFPDGTPEHVMRNSIQAEFYGAPALSQDVPAKPGMFESMMPRQSLPEQTAEAQIGLEAMQQGLTPEQYKSEVYPEGSRLKRLEQMGDNVISGALGTAEGLIGGVEWISGSETAKELADVAKAWREEMAPEDPTFVDEIAMGVGSMATFFIPGIGVARGAEAAALLAPKLAVWAGVGISSALEAMTEAGLGYRETLQDTKEVKKAEDAALKTFWMNMVLLPVTNKLGIFGEKGGKVRKAIMSSLMEGSQEGAQEIIAAVSQNKDIDPEAVLRSAGVGAIVGGGVSVVTPGSKGQIEQPIEEDRVDLTDLDEKYKPKPEDKVKAAAEARQAEIEKAFEKPEDKIKTAAEARQAEIDKAFEEPVEEKVKTEPIIETRAKEVEEVKPPTKREEEPVKTTVSESDLIKAEKYPKILKEKIKAKDLVESKTRKEIQEKLQRIFGTYQALDEIEKGEKIDEELKNNRIVIADKYMADLERSAVDREYDTTEYLLEKAYGAIEKSYLNQYSQGQYFKITENSQLFDLDDIQSTEKPDKRKLKKTWRYMSDAKRNLKEKREPLQLFKRQDGKLVILDGNHTYFVLKNRGEKIAVGEIKKTIKQPKINNLDELYKKAEGNYKELKRLTEKTSKKYNATAWFRPNDQELKSKERSKQKIEGYGGDASQLKDVIASTVSFKTEKEMYRALEEFDREHGVLDLRDRFKKPLPTGYRDILMVVRLKDGALAEIQFTKDRLFEAKEHGAGHELYKLWRELDEVWIQTQNKEAKNFRDEITSISKKYYDHIYQSNNPAISLALTSEISSELNITLDRVSKSDISTLLDPSILKTLSDPVSKTKGTPSESKKRSDIKTPPSKNKEKITQQPGKVKKVVAGSDRKLMVPGNNRETITFAVMEQKDLIPSHRPETFAKHPQYPEGVQERMYHSDKNEQLKVIGHAKNLKTDLILTNNPDAINGPPIVLENGIVLGGNSRAMTLQRAYMYDSQYGKGSKFKKKLIQFADQFGLDPEKVREFDEPVLVRIYKSEATDQKTLHKLASLFNAPLTQGMSAEAKTVSMGKNVSPETLENIGGRLTDRDLTLRQLLDKKDGVEILRRLIQDGVLTENEFNTYYNDKYDQLNNAGKEMIEKTILGAVIDDQDLLSVAPKAMTNKIAYILSPVARIRSRGDQWDITHHLKDAFEIAVKVKSDNNIGSVGQLMAQGSLFGDEKPMSSEAVILAHLLADEKPTSLLKRFKGYASDAAKDIKNQKALFAPPSQQESFNEWFIENSPSNNLFDSIGSEAGFINIDMLIPKKMAEKIKKVALGAQNFRLENWYNYLRGRQDAKISVILQKKHMPQLGSWIRNMESILSQTDEGRKIYESGREFKEKTIRRFLKWEAEYNEAVEGLSDQEKKTVLKILDSTEEITGDHPTEIAAAKIRTLLKGVREHLIEHGHQVSYLEGYLPHVFQGRFWVSTKDEFSHKVETIGQALQVAQEWIEKGKKGVKVMQDAFIPPDDATMLSKRGYWRLVKAIQKQVGESIEIFEDLDTDEIHQMLSEGKVARPKPRKRFFGNTMRRVVDNPNYIKNLDEIMRLYLYGASRKVGQDIFWRKVQRNIDAMPAGDQRLKQFIETVYLPGTLAHPTNMEEAIANIFHKLKIVPGFTGQDFRKIMHNVNLVQYVWDLGLSGSSAIANASQFFMNAYPIVGEVSALKGYRKGAKTFFNKKLLAEVEQMGITQSVSAITGEILISKDALKEFKRKMLFKAGPKGFAEATLIPFTTVEVMNRFSTYWAGKDFAGKQLNKGKSAAKIARLVVPDTSSLFALGREIDDRMADGETKRNASWKAKTGRLQVEFSKKFGYELNDKVNFRVGRENLPQIIREVPARLFSPYKSFLLNQLKYTVDTLNPKGIKTNPKKALRFTIMTLALAGVAGNPIVYGLFQMLRYLYKQLFDVDIEKELRRKNLLRGIPGKVGLDISGSVAIQMPRRLYDLLGRYGKIAVELGTLAYEKGTGAGTIRTERKLKRQTMPAQMQRVADAMEILGRGEYITPITRTPVGMSEKPWVAAVKRAAGILPADVARAFDEEREIEKLKKKYKSLSSDLTERWAEAIKNGDPEKMDRTIRKVVHNVNNALDRLSEAKNPDQVASAMTDLLFWQAWIQKDEKFKNAILRKHIPRQIMKKRKLPKYLQPEAAAQ
jgi:DdrB-like nuclease